MHRMSDEWQALKVRVDGFLDGFAFGSDELLHYVGLLPNYFFKSISRGECSDLELSNKPTKVGHSPPAGMKIGSIFKADIMDKVHPEE